MLYDLRVACEHRKYDEHLYDEDISKDTRGFQRITISRTCPGGRPAAIGDLEGALVWWCDFHHSSIVSAGPCDFALRFKHLPDMAKKCRKVRRILIREP